MSMQNLKKLEGNLFAKESGVYYREATQIEPARLEAWAVVGSKQLIVCQVPEAIAEQMGTEYTIGELKKHIGNYEKRHTN